MKNYNVTLRLIDGSLHDTSVSKESEKEVVSFIELCITNNELIQTRDRQYGDLFGKGYVFGKHVIAFHINTI